LSNEEVQVQVKTAFSAEFSIKIIFGVFAVGQSGASRKELIDKKLRKWLDYNFPALF
jgi:hypothetical protein